MLPLEMNKLKQLKDENARLNRIVADPTLDRERLGMKLLQRSALLA